MNDKEHIEEMGVDICKGCNSRLDPTFECNRNVCTMAEIVSEYLIDIGWTKQVWHKVSENDLPTRQGQKVWIYTKSGDYYEANYYDDTVIGGKVFFERRVLGRIGGKDVIAWAYLPKYEEK